MTEAERKQKFIDAYGELVKQYGFTIAAWQETRQLGPVIQVEIKSDVQPVQGWTEGEAGTAQPNGQPV
jgi:hypothetical protein